MGHGVWFPRAAIPQPLLAAAMQARLPAIQLAETRNLAGPDEYESLLESVSDEEITVVVPLFLFSKLAPRQKSDSEGTERIERTAIASLTLGGRGSASSNFEKK